MMKSLCLAAVITAVIALPAHAACVDVPAPFVAPVDAGHRAAGMRKLGEEVIVDLTDAQAAALTGGLSAPARLDRAIAALNARHAAKPAAWTAEDAQTLKALEGLKAAGTAQRLHPFLFQAVMAAGHPGTYKATLCGDELHIIYHTPGHFKPREAFAPLVVFLERRPGGSVIDILVGD